MKITRDRVQRSIDFIEDHLFEPLTLDDVAGATGLSRYHLHRVFSATYGDSLKSYIRKRRLTEAAALLRSSDTRIIELAVSCGFGSQEAFTRAFRNQFGVTPGQYRRDSASRRLPGLFKPGPDGVKHRQLGISHQPRIVERTRALRVRGPGIGIDFENDAPVAELWRSVLASLTSRGVDAETAILYGVTQARHPDIATTPEQCLAYVAGVTPDLLDSTERPEASGAIVDVTIPPGCYAVFDHHGSLDHITDTVNYVWATWLPRSEYLKSTRPDFERVPLAQLAARRPRVELWVSIDDPESQTR